jgi:hypothetical protein
MEYHSSSPVTFHPHSFPLDVLHEQNLCFLEKSVAIDLQRTILCNLNSHDNVIHKYVGIGPVTRSPSTRLEMCKTQLMTTLEACT